MSAVPATQAKHVLALAALYAPLGQPVHGVDEFES